MSDTILYQVHLNLPHCCKRGVRYRELSGSEVRTCESLGAADALAASADGKTANGMEVRNATLAHGLRRMIVSVTDPVAEIGGATWHDVTLQALESPSSPLNFEKLFPGARDDQLLSRLYSELHEVTQSDVDAIMGKRIPVSPG